MRSIGHETTIGSEHGTTEIQALLDVGRNGCQLKDTIKGRSFSVFGNSITREPDLPATLFGNAHETMLEYGQFNQIEFSGIGLICLLFNINTNVTTISDSRLAVGLDENRTVRARIRVTQFSSKRDDSYQLGSMIMAGPAIESLA